MADRQVVELDPAVVAAFGLLGGDVTSPATSEQVELARRDQPGETRPAKPDTGRTKITFELNTDVVGALRAAAGREQISPASLVNVLVAQGLTRMVDGDLRVADHLVKVRHPVYRYGSSSARHFGK